MTGGYVSAADAVRRVESGWTVGLMHACGEPQSLVEALTNRAAELRGVRVLTGWHQVSPAPYAAVELAQSFTPVTPMPSRITRRAIAEGRGEYLPLKFGEFARAIRSGEVPVDVAMMQVSPPDAQGMCSLGVSVDYAHAMLDRAAVRLVEVNPHMPVTAGDSLVPFDIFDAAVRVDRPLLELRLPVATAVERAVGESVAGLVPDGATLQVGVGTMPDAVLAALGTHKDLGIHSGQISDGMLALMDAGAVTGARKTADPGMVIAGSAFGTRELFAALPRSSGFEMRPATYTHDPEVLLSLEGLVAINSALEVDLAGNVNAEMAGGQRISGPGGQPEFATAAIAVPDGQSIIVLPATAKGRTISRIVSRLNDDAPVTTPGEHITAVVTENGAADLRGLSTRARADAIAAVAAPDFRDALLRAAAEY